MELGNDSFGRVSGYPYTRHSPVQIIDGACYFTILLFYLCNLFLQYANISLFVPPFPAILDRLLMC